MRISLTRSGGFVPLIKKATEEVDWSEKEIYDLLNRVKADDQPGNSRDSHQYQLIYNNQSFSIDLEKIPEKYKEMFEHLKNNLKIVKPE